jgi:CDP-paratose 2-epimerase
MSAPSSPAVVGIRPVLVTGGAGFIGSNLADRLASQGRDVLLYDALSRPGVERNVEWLRRRHPERISLVHKDIRDHDALEGSAQEASAVFHLAAQVAVTTSLHDPQTDFAVNAGSTIALLEALRRRSLRIPLVFASTNKVYGDLADVALTVEGEAYTPVDPLIRSSGIGEDRPIAFHTPYGCSKGAADQYVLDYARSFGMPTAVLRMSCIYGQRQMGTEDQGWLAHFVIRALSGEPISIYGDGRQVRDVLDVSDAVEAYLAAWGRIGAIQGKAFNLGGGPANAISLLALVAQLETLLDTRIALSFADWRAGDQRYYVSDARRIRRDLGLPPPTPWRDGVARLVAWMREEGLAEATTSAKRARSELRS